MQAHDGPLVRPHPSRRILQFVAPRRTAAAATIALPEGYVRVRELGGDFPRRLFWIERRERPSEEAEREGGEAPLECTGWTCAPHPDRGVQCVRTFRERWPDGSLSRTRQSQFFDGLMPWFTAYPRAEEFTWIEAPDEGGEAPVSGPIGYLQPLTVVERDAHSLGYVEADHVYAYHPSEVRRWYTRRAHCQAALRGEPIPEEPVDPSVLDDPPAEDWPTEWP